MSVNKVILVGNVGRDPEVRYLDGNGQNGQGTKVATFTLATSESKWATKKFFVHYQAA